MQRASSGNLYERRIKKEDETPVEAHPQVRPICAPMEHKWKISMPYEASVYLRDGAAPSHQLRCTEALQAHGDISLSDTKPETSWEVPKHRTQAQRTWLSANSGSWWWTGRGGMLQSMGSQRVGHNWVTELNWSKLETSWEDPKHRTHPKTKQKRFLDNPVPCGCDISPTDNKDSTAWWIC